MTYTAIVLLALFAALLLDVFILRTRILFTGRYAMFMVVMLVFFLVVNGILTALPVVTYAPTAIIGIRVFTIPIEDFAYLFALLTPTIALYEYLSGLRRRRVQHKPHLR
ncbi:MAG: lycopene cyclase domain-containing protein [Bacteroidetes bacterium]|nr:lycopene cyclase domain-containing protein [Bacteroidota bacterium]